MTTRHTSILLLLAILLIACEAKVQVPQDGQDDDTSVVDTLRDTVRDTTVVIRDPVDTTDRGDTPTPQRKGNITVQTPRAGDRITEHRILLKGTARTFENNVNYRLLDSNGNALIEGHTTAVGDMGTFNPYTATITVPAAYSGRATLEVLDYSAKDGSRQDVVTIPLVIEGTGTSATTEISLYFTNARMNPGSDCERVFAVKRRVEKTTAIAERALRELLNGPTPSERQEGYGSEIPPGTTLRRVRIDNGVATADFDETLNASAGACSVTAARSEIVRTLRQFPTVRSVVIRVNGQGVDVLQP